MSTNFDSMLNVSAVPQDDRTAAFIAESKNNRNRCYELSEQITCLLYTSWAGIRRISHGMQHFGEWKQISSEKQAEVINTIHFVFQRKEFVVKYTYLNQRLICYRMPRWRSWMGKTGEKRICYLLRGFTDRYRNLRKVRYLLHWFVS